jgi:hypothetical protein
MHSTRPRRASAAPARLSLPITPSACVKLRGDQAQPDPRGGLKPCFETQHAIDAMWLYASVALADG